jgi:hypothetical protein
MIITVQTHMPNTRLPLDVDLEDFGSWEEFAADLYAKSMGLGSLYVPAMAYIPGLPEPLPIATANPEEIWAIHECVDSYGDEFGAFLSLGMHSSDVTQWAEEFQEAYQGTYDGVETWAKEHMESTYDDLFHALDEGDLLGYFDFETWADHELAHDYTWDDLNGRTVVFQSI